MRHGGSSSADLGTIARSTLENETTAFTVLEAAHATHLSTRDGWQLGFRSSGVARARATRRERVTPEKEGVHISLVIGLPNLATKAD
jgi:hypothetical protein